MKINLFIFCSLFTLNIFAIPFNKLSPIQQKIHSLLCKIVLSETEEIVKLKENDERNRCPNLFAVALEIETTDNKTYVFLLSNFIEGGIAFRSGIGGPIQEQKLMLLQKRKKLHEILQDEDRCVIATRLKQKNYRTPSFVQTNDYCYARGLTDSEFACINFLETNTEDIVDKLQASLPKGTNITHIAFHGFTTRDMCPACYHHINLYCQMANQAQSNSVFWRKMRESLELSEGFSVNFFISSLVDFPNKNFLNKCKEGNVEPQGLNCITFRQTPDSKLDVTEGIKIFNSPKISNKNLDKDCYEFIAKHPELFGKLAESILLIKNVPQQERVVDITTLLSEILLEESGKVEMRTNVNIFGNDYTLNNVLGDGNCAFRALSVAMDGDTNRHEEIRTQTANLMQRQTGEIAIRGQEIENVGTWVGLETLYWAHQALQRNIFVIIELNGRLYWVYIDNNNSLEFHAIQDPGDIPNLLEQYRQDDQDQPVLRLYYSHYHFQAIIHR